MKETNRTLLFFIFLTISVLSIRTFAQPKISDFYFKDCQAHWSSNEITISNKFIERRWKIKNGLLLNTSLKNVSTGKEFLKTASFFASPAPEFPISENCLSVQIMADTCRTVIVEDTSLHLQLKSVYTSYVFTTHVKIYPGSAAISTWLSIETKTDALDRGNQVAKFRIGIEEQSITELDSIDLNESFIIENKHKVLTTVSLMDNTDEKDNLVQESRYLTTNNSKENFKGNLFYLEDQFEHDGIIFLKEAPLPYARPVKTSSDLLFNGSQFIFKGLGAGSGTSRISYPQTVILYQGGKPGMSKALQDYQRNFKRYDPESDVIWHSIWGDRNRDGRVNEKFYSEELEKNRNLGIDLLYFIDGWQKGISSNSVDRELGGVWEGQWKQADYWTYNPTRFPNGIKPIINRATQYGYKTGFWYNPDNTNDYANWSRDADVLINFHRLYDSKFFKYDGVVFKTKTGEINLLNAMHKVVQESNGKASIEIDITAGIRTGYYSAMSYGFLFLENRYTDWQKYYPHTTLRNLWQLSHYVDPRRLRMEFLNNERNTQLYGVDPLAPSNYTADYLFASTMFALPMAWLESTGLSDTYSAALKKIIAVYKPNRQEIHEGNILPIGNEPDGFSWTGFISQKPDSECGYIVVFRELNDAESMEFDLPTVLAGKYNFELLSGNGETFNVLISKNRKVKFELPKKQNYAFYRYCQQK